MSLLRDFRRPRLWLGLWIAAIATVIVLSLIPPPPMVVPRNFDKVEHLLGYLLLSAGAVLLFARCSTQLWAAAGLVAMGAALEFAQSTLTQTRVGDLADALANTTGVATGLLLSATPLAGWLQRMDARLR
ncbi:MAG TPA: VanZ family protein [Lysobacter sp.]|nr:VanZ family protein [Lysobacter sp.]